MPVVWEETLAKRRRTLYILFSSLPYTHLGNTSGNEMEKCFWGRFPVVRASSLFYYAKGGDVAQILYAMKYHARKKLCCKMGEYMAGELCDSGFLKE